MALVGGSAAFGEAGGGCSRPGRGSATDAPRKRLPQKCRRPAFAAARRSHAFGGVPGLRYLKREHQSPLTGHSTNRSAALSYATLANY